MFRDHICHNEQSCEQKSRSRDYFRSGNRGPGPLRKVVTFFFSITGPTNYLTPGPGIAARVPLGLAVGKTDILARLFSPNRCAIVWFAYVSK